MDAEHGRHAHRGAEAFARHREVVRGHALDVVELRVALDGLDLRGGQGRALEGEEVAGDAQADGEPGHEVDVNAAAEPAVTARDGDGVGGALHEAARTGERCKACAELDVRIKAADGNVEAELAAR